MRTVRFFEFSTKTIITIPAAELTPECAPALVDGVDGEVYVNPAETDQSCVAIYGHPPFPVKYRQAFETFAEVFHDVWDFTPHRWATVFRGYLRPERKITKWLKIARVFEAMTAGKRLSKPCMLEYFQIITHVFAFGPRKALDMVEPEAISEGEARRIVRRIERGV